MRGRNARGPEANRVFQLTENEPLCTLVHMTTVIETRPFTDWMASLKDLKTRARIAERLRRVAISGSLGDAKDIGGGLSELRFHFGPGYRVYFCRRGTEVVILLGGGGKGSQSRDIKAAKALAQEG